MEDATELCDRVAFIVDGKIKAFDTPHNLIMRKNATEIFYTYKENEVKKEGSCPLSNTAEDTTSHQLIAQNKILTIHSKEQTLGDVFMDITGRRLS